MAGKQQAPKKVRTSVTWATKGRPKETQVPIERHWMYITWCNTFECIFGWIDSNISGHAVTHALFAPGLSCFHWTGVLPMLPAASAGNLMNQYGNFIVTISLLRHVDRPTRQLSASCQELSSKSISSWPFWSFSTTAASKIASAPSPHPHLAAGQAEMRSQLIFSATATAWIWCFKCVQTFLKRNDGKNEGKNNQIHQKPHNF